MASDAVAAAVAPPGRRISSSSSSSVVLPKAKEEERDEHEFRLITAAPKSTNEKFRTDISAAAARSIIAAGYLCFAGSPGRIWTSGGEDVYPPLALSCPFLLKRFRSVSALSLLYVCVRSSRFAVFSGETVSGSYFKSVSFFLDKRSLLRHLTRV